MKLTHFHSTKAMFRSELPKTARSSPFILMFAQTTHKTIFCKAVSTNKQDDNVKGTHKHRASRSTAVLPFQGRPACHCHVNKRLNCNKSVALMRKLAPCKMSLSAQCLSKSATLARSDRCKMGKETAYFC